MKIHPKESEQKAPNKIMSPSTILKTYNLQVLA
jgi:hypothetical protein